MRFTETPDQIVDCVSVHDGIGIDLLVRAFYPDITDGNIVYAKTYFKRQLERLRNQGRLRSEIIKGACHWHVVE